MIPKNIEREHVIKAIEEAEKAGIREGRSSRKFFLEYNSRYYPPKYIISLANKHANGKELDSSEFSGGTETNSFLKALGFKIVRKPFLQKFEGESFMEKAESPRPETKHDERCPKCKETVGKFLEKIYGKVESNMKIEIGTHPEDFRSAACYEKLVEIHEALQNHRGFKEFVKAITLPNCDFFIPNPAFIVEFDESQHFSLPRKITLEHYPNKLGLGFDRKRWMTLCETINAKDNDPPYRDEQRAWYDTLRDFLPEIKGLEPTVRLYSKEMQWCSLNPESPEDIATFRRIIESRRRRLSGWVATVILQSNERYSNDDRLKALSQITDLVTEEMEEDGVILFPGGWFNAGKQEARNLYGWVEENVRNILNGKKGNVVICLGLDGRIAQYAKDQIGIAISKNGIIAMGRKFHPAPEEKGHVELAKDHLSKEENKSRVFDLNGRKYFLCACYDSFGIKHRGIPNFGIDVILDLVHRFYPKGEGPSGNEYFARHGFAGASKEWDCLVFGAAVFFNRKIPEHWPSGVYWNQGSKSTQEWKYSDNPIKPLNEIFFENPEGIALIRIYSFN